MREVLAPVEKDSRGRKKGTNQTPKADSSRTIANELGITDYEARVNTKLDALNSEG